MLAWLLCHWSAIDPTWPSGIPLHWAGFAWLLPGLSNEVEAWCQSFFSEQQDLGHLSRATWLRDDQNLWNKISTDQSPTSIYYFLKLHIITNQGCRFTNYIIYIFNRDTFLDYSEFPWQNETEMETYFKTGMAFNYINRLNASTINWKFFTFYHFCTENLHPAFSFMRLNHLCKNKLFIIHIRKNSGDHFW